MKQILHAPGCFCLAVYELLPSGESHFVEWKMVCYECMELTRKERREDTNG